MRSTFIAHPGAQRGCPTCAGGGYVIGRTGAVATAHLCDCAETCPLCKGEGFRPASEDRRAPLVPCTCQVLSHRIELYGQAHIPARHADSTRASFDYSENWELMGTLTGWLNAYRPGADNRSLVFWGKVGRGKTHLMCAILRELILEQGVSARFVEFSHLLADLKSSFEKRSGAADLMDPLTRVEVLAIDELGKGRNTEFEGTVVDELVSRRYNAGSTILATTNYPPGPATGAATPNLSAPDRTLPTLPDRVGERVYSRLREMGDFAECKGGDYRERKHHP